MSGYTQSQSEASQTIVDRTGIEGSIDRAVSYLRGLPWYIYLVVSFGALVPIFAINLPGIGGMGAADLLMPVSALVILALPRQNGIQLSHIALLGFAFAALISLLQIEETKPAIDCSIRWFRLFGIIAPFYFGLFIPVTNRVAHAALKAWIFGGFIAILIGIVLHIFQIEVRAGQQRLWMDGGSILRAGGLIGNSGAFGHMTSTWAVATITYLLVAAKHRWRFVCAGFAFICTLYVIYISSSRAAMLHLFAASLTFIILVRLPKAVKSWVPLAAVFGGLTIGILLCTSIFMQGGSSSNGEPSALESNLARFIPGFGGASVEEFTSNRAGNWPQYIEMMNEKAVTGWGYKMGVRIHEESPDNSYLSVMLETGAFGFVCMALFVGGVLYHLFRGYISNDNFAIILLAMCVGQLINCMTSDIYTFWITMPVVFMLLGIVSQRSSKQNIESD